MRGRVLLVAALCASAARLGAQADAGLSARLRAAVAQYERGERDAAKREFNRLAEAYNARGGQLPHDDLVAVAVAVTYLGVDEPQLFKDALAVYDRALELDPGNLETRARLAELFLDKYNSADAKRTLAEIFKRDDDYVPALVLEARRRDFDGERGADSVLARALQREPENVKARVLRARFMADVEDFEGAVREVQRALRADANHAEALALGVALSAVRGDSSGREATLRRYAARYPRDAGALVATAELLARVRQYGLAAEWARKATELDASSWRGHSVLGLNLLRLGRIAEGRRSLERAFEGDPYNVWVKNTLDLLDTFGEYDEIEHGRFRFMIEKAESGVIALYLADLADRAYATFSARYGFTPSTPIRMEVYRSHADFSVRTVGLAGLGALGVSFGNTVAFDSPAARDAGSFTWASTAWHELAHTFTLGASDQRVPRWLSEGLSVFEERKARPGWGQAVTPAFLQAYSEGRLHPPSRLNDGFIRPAFPQQVLFSYYQASLVCELIAKEWGERALPDMLRAYRSGLSPAQVVQRVLRTDPAALDRRFDAYLRERFGRAINALKSGEYQRLVAEGRTLLQRGNAAGATAALERARALFPEYGGADGAYPLLANALLAANERKRAADVMVARAALGEMPFDAHVALADLLLQTGDTARAAHALEGAMYVNPFAIAQHERLARLYAAVGERKKAVRERRAVVALRPVDRAEAYYQLALAQRDAGDLADARRSVVRALEDAPHFERAQELLLTLREARKP